MACDCVSDLICFGTAGLSLPGMTTRGAMPILDACFTATSAVCVTGLTVVDTEQDFTVWGQLVILILIQCGGIGIITVASSLSVAASLVPDVKHAIRNSRT